MWTSEPVTIVQVRNHTRRIFVINLVVHIRQKEKITLKGPTVPYLLFIFQMHRALTPLTKVLSNPWSAAFNRKSSTTSSTFTRDWIRNWKTSGQETEPSNIPSSGIPESMFTFFAKSPPRLTFSRKPLW